jgi:Flp pilus assembly protein TadG
MTNIERRNRGPIGETRAGLRLGLRTARETLLDERGAETVEFAIMLLVFFALMFGIVEFGRVLWTQNALHYATQQAARCAAVNSTLCGTQDLMRTFAAGVAGAGVPGSAFWLTSPDPTCGKQVTASYTVNLYVPLLSMNPTLTASACFPKAS